eukprot:Rhum_TRINITY_DN14713_c4_g1::Rhum_TRINITY_DN14713_c4_g1_i1::g.111460::m.111460/K03174/TRAF3; TNF receptor-associated factor 3
MLPRLGSSSDYCSAHDSAVRSPKGARDGASSPLSPRDVAASGSAVAAAAAGCGRPSAAACSGAAEPASCRGDGCSDVAGGVYEEEEEESVVVRLAEQVRGSLRFAQCRDETLFVSCVSDELLCPVGRGVLMVPLVTPCGHEFCPPCLQKAVQHREECPMCRRPLSLNEVDALTLSEATCRATEALTVRCDNAKKSCQWEGAAGQLHAHVRSECPEEVVDCPHNGCTAHLPRRELRVHQAWCVRRPVSCAHCGAQVANEDAAVHEGQLCPEVPAPCPNRCRDAPFTRSTLAAHLTVCELQDVACPFAPHGCAHGKMMRRDVAAHCTEHATQHSLLLCEKVTAQERVIEEQALHIEKLMQRSVIIVSKDGMGHFSCIADGLAHAEDGDRIHVKPGLYKECLVLTKKVSLVADGKVTIQNGRDFNVIVMKDGARIRGFELRQRSKSFFCIRIISTCEDTLVENCDIRSDHFSCVQVDSHANPLIRHNVIHDSQQCGILVKSLGRGRILHNVIHTNSLSNVYADQNSAPIVQYNEIHGSRQHGVWVKPHSAAEVAHNVIFNNRMEDIKVEEGSLPTLRNNTFHRPAHSPPQRLTS